MPSPSTPDDDKTPGRDSLTRAFYDPMWATEPTLEKMRQMPDEWQGQMAKLINEFALAEQVRMSDHPTLPI